MWDRRAEYSLRAAEAMETVRMMLYGDGIYPIFALMSCQE